MQAQTAVLSAVPESDSDKRRQILMGASEVFLEKGYDAASMSEIARVAGVSKGTLYVYFKNKEELFDSIVWGVCKLQSEQDFNIDNNDHDVTAVLTRFGTLVADMMCRPETISGLRVVIAISARMTEMGQRFYLEGPANTVAKLRSYLEAQNAAGILAVGDCELAAAQFIDSVTATTFKPVLFNFDPPTPDRIAYVVGVSVHTFLAAYGKKQISDSKV